MKNRFVAFALLIAGFVSVTSGCIVREGGHPYHHHYYHGY